MNQNEPKLSTLLWLIVVGGGIGVGGGCILNVQAPLI